MTMQTKTIKITALLITATLCAFVATPMVTRGQQSKPSPTPAGNSAISQQAPPNYNRFTHQTHLGVVKVPGTFQAHELKCDSCHDQRDLAKDLVPNPDHNKQRLLKFPGHKACVECHVQQFTSLPQETCSICHVVKQGPNNGLTVRPPQRDFPGRSDFNAFFDSKQHETHVAYKLPDGGKIDCKSCHKQTDKPAPLAVASHPECYVCHSPNSLDQKASLKSGCIVCHTEQRADDVSVYGRLSKAFGAKFEHKTHVGYAKDNCFACHTISGGYNQNSPVSLKTTAHNTGGQIAGKGCFTCHNGRTAFSGEPGSTRPCSTCHTRDDGKVFPLSGLN